VHHDRRVHVSQLANRFVSDAREVVKTGDVVKVRVVEVDLARKRIALTMKLDAPVPRGDKGDNRYQAAGRQERPRSAPHDPAPAGGAMAAAFAKLAPRR
jgi:uncharacterized protein